MPAYRIRLDRTFSANRRIELRKFKFRLHVWTSSSMVSTTVHAALDTFADYSVLPTQALIRGGELSLQRFFFPA
jgi:hypothetical protein